MVPHALVTAPNARLFFMSRLVSGAILAATLFACTQEPTIPEIGEDPVSVSLQLSTLTLATGEKDTIRAIVRNNLDRSVRLDFPGTCQVYVTIRNANGNVVTPRDGRPECLPVPSVLTIAFGSSHQVEVVWSGGFMFDPASTQERVPPGSYFVTAEVIADRYSTVSPPYKIEVQP